MTALAMPELQFLKKYDREQRAYFSVEHDERTLGIVERDPSNLRKWLVYVGRAVPVQCVNLAAARALFVLEVVLAEHADKLRATAAELRAWDRNRRAQTGTAPTEPFVCHPFRAANRLEQMAEQISSARKGVS